MKVKELLSYSRRPPALARVGTMLGKKTVSPYDSNEKSARGLWDLTWKGSDGLSSLHVRAQPHPQCSRSAGKIASLMFAPPEDGDVVSREHWKEHAQACELGGLTPAQQPRSAPRSTRCGHGLRRHFCEPCLLWMARTLKRSLRLGWVGR